MGLSTLMMEHCLSRAGLSHDGLVNLQPAVGAAVAQSLQPGEACHRDHWKLECADIAGGTGDASILLDSPFIFLYRKISLP